MSVLDQNGQRVWPGDVVKDANGHRYEVLTLVRRGRNNLRAKQLDGTRRGIELLDSSEATLQSGRR